ncbi:MAG TPA: M28 family metallopeptidase [Vicinamibacterales bacterium]
MEVSFGRARRLAVPLAVATAVLLTAAWQREPDPPFGFTRARAAAERDLERRFLGAVSANRIRDAHALLADKPHVAGSPRDRELADWTRERFIAYGLEEVAITTHEVLLPWPTETRVEMVSPRAWRASMREEPIAGDRYTQISPEEAGIPYHAYSASGEVTAPVVYAGSGNPEDYDRLARQGLDIRGRIALVRYSVPYSYRGFKALTAQKRGAAGILIYSDPEDDGAGKGKVYPEGPWGPESHIQRGGVVYDFMVPGDPLTPGWPSLPGARRIDRTAAISLPSIVSAPMSFKDARVLLDALGVGSNRNAPQNPAALPVVRMTVQSDDRIRPIWTVTGMIRGSEDPDDVVVVGNHRDAWVYGGVDPSSGSAALMELARTLGQLAREGWRPKRSILFASWDAEEFTLTSSTEWGEQHAGWLRDHAVAYLNVDSAASGRAFTATAVPALNRAIADAAAAVRDPESPLSVGAMARERRAQARGALPTGSSSELVDNQLGSGSDYTVFLNFLGIPVADLTFDGPYGVYHSIYDNHNWVARIGDPGFTYHVSLVQVWGLLALRLSSADIVPLDYEPYAAKLADFARAVEARTPGGEGFDELRTSIARLRTAAAALNARRDRALANGDAAAARAIDRALIAAERHLTDDAGLQGRPWYRHLVFAPKPTYAPELLPGIAEAQDAADTAGVAREVRRLARAIDRLTGTFVSDERPATPLSFSQRRNALR